jgi:hypothetical protein
MTIPTAMPTRRPVATARSPNGPGADPGRGLAADPKSSGPVAARRHHLPRGGAHLLRSAGAVPRPAGARLILGRWGTGRRRSCRAAGQLAPGAVKSFRLGNQPSAGPARRRRARGGHRHLIALWSASGYIAAFMQAVTAIYGIDEGRSIWRTAPVRLAVTVAVGVMPVASAAGRPHRPPERQHDAAVRLDEWDRVPPGSAGVFVTADPRTRPAPVVEPRLVLQPGIQRCAIWPVPSAYGAASVGRAPAVLGQQRPQCVVA